MRTIWLLFCSIIGIHFVYAQAPKNAVSIEDAAFSTSFATRTLPKVSGILLNIPADELKKIVVTYYLVTPFSSRQSKRTATVAADGKFELQLDYPFPYQQIWLSVGETFYTGLYANQDLFLELDMEKIKAAKEVNFNGPGVRFLGTDGPLNAYMNNYVLYKKSEQQNIAQRQGDLMFSRKPGPIDSVLQAFALLSEEKQKIEQSYIAENPSSYAWILENERMSAYYENLCAKFWGKEMNDTLWQKVKAHKSYLVSNEGAGFYTNLAVYLNFYPKNSSSANWKDVKLLKDLTEQEKKIIDTLEMVSLSTDDAKRLNRMLNPRIQKILLVKTVDRGIRLLDSLFPPAKADFLKLHLNTSKDLAEQQLVMEHIIPSMHSESWKNISKKEYAGNLKKVNEINNTLAKSTVMKSTGILPGKAIMQTNFGASMYKVSDMKLDEFLVKLKQSFPGKAIILDRWATWCGPCLNEMPHSKKLLEDTKSMPVVFVYLCTVSGSSEAKWKTKVAELKQPGIHFFIDEKLDVEIGKFFSFSGYPGYAFIDKEGKYKPGAITWISQIDKEGVAKLLE